MGVEHVLSFSHADLLSGDFPEPEPVIEGLIDAGEPSLWSAIFGAGKSWLALEAARAVAAGDSFLCHFAVKQGAVLYLDSENNHAGVARRLELLQRWRPIPPDAPIAFRYADGLALTDGATLSWLDGQLADVRPVLLIVDSWVRFLGPVNENDAGAVAQVNGNLRALARTHGNATLILDHVRKSPPGGGDSPEHRTRGSGEKGGFVANLLTLEPMKEEGVLLATTVKRRYGPKPDPFAVTREYDAGTDAVSLTYGATSGKPDDATPGEIMQAIAEVKAQWGADASTSTTVGDWLGKSESTARRALTQAVRLGWVTTRMVGGKGKSGRPTRVYDILEREAA